MAAYTILVAFCVNAETRAEAQRELMLRLPDPVSDKYWPSVGPHEVIDSWWIAEDDRIDGSDNNSAVFVPMGSQAAAVRSLTAMEKM